jgi:hypothetical protein
MISQEHNRLKNRTIEKALRYLIKRYVTCANLRRLEWSLSDELAIQLMGSNCHYCGCDPAMHCRGFKFNGIDRKDSKLGYIIDNVLPCCTPCNRAKGRTGYQQFQEWLDRLAQYRRPDTLSRDEQARSNAKFEARKEKERLRKAARN